MPNPSQHTHPKTTGHNGAHAHDHGFAHDLPRLIGRRRLLGLLAGIGATAAAPALALDQCLAMPSETAGPFPANGTRTSGGLAYNVLDQAGVIRSDMRSSFGGMTSVAEGTQLDIALELASAGENCTPLAGYAIYVWHCDAVGKYSLYDMEDNFLRAVGIAGADGKVSFTTIFPGCYPSRWPHVHFEVFDSPLAAVSGSKPVLTSQWAFEEKSCREVYSSNPAYSNGIENLNRLNMRTDTIFSDNNDAQMEAQTMQTSGSPEAGYTGSLRIAIAL